MTRLIWNEPEKRYFDTGLDRGVLYLRREQEPGPLLAENLIENPSFENGLEKWTTTGIGSTGSTSFNSTAISETPYGARVCEVSASALGTSIDDYVGIYTPSMVIRRDRFHTAGITFGGSLPPGKKFFIKISYFDINDDLVEELVEEFSEEGRYEKHLVLDEASNNVQLTFGVRGGAGSLSSVSFWMDGAMLKEGATDDFSSSYFDGSFPKTSDREYFWTGTPHDSKSLAREVRPQAVPWNGLTSVDEEGADSAVSYYIDGRPFLYLPRIKEYKATIKAYTYPDEFSEVMGVSEIADGMYLDSQMGESFDLCYRTLVGNGTEGLDHGYKIHLVYNAVVSPKALSYSSISNSINPVEFEWEIQAVPTKVEGFRPTAHVIIDTRHLDPSKVQAVENLLYGSDSSIAHMPSPETIFDILNFGDMIVVTDNGDGTFDVSGSYENVYLISPGVFRVDNVDGTNNGDGTFTISTTTT